jgi:KaiC/GvpD/RAD55 family RecA-like ATPase
MNFPNRGDDGETPVSTGIEGLDNILSGGLDPDRIFLVEGEPGTGKTTLALQFLLAGARHGEKGLYVTLSESTRELRVVAARHGWSIDDFSVFELVPPEATLDPDKELTLFHPAELELSETSKMILDRVNQVSPSRVVFDSLSEMRLLAQNSLRYRRQILALKHFFAGRRSTVLLLDDFSAEKGDLQLHSIAHGVISLHQSALDYGAERRRLRVKKMRGVKFRGGYHDFIILFVPSKVTSYLCAERPIVIAAPFQNVAAQSIRESSGGRVVPPDDATAMRDAVQAYLDNPQLRNQAARRGRLYAEQTFDIEKIADRFERLFERLRTGPPRRRERTAATAQDDGRPLVSADIINRG